MSRSLKTRSVRLVRLSASTISGGLWDEISLTKDPFALWTTSPENVVIAAQAAIADGDMDRVDTALSWGREHAADKKAAKDELRSLLRVGVARVLLHEAARSVETNHWFGSARERP